MKEVRVFVPFGAVGIGVGDEAFQAGLDLNPDVISSDCGSTDSGPYYLGTGNGKYARESVKSDLRKMVVAGAKRGIPVTLGTVGTCGVDRSVDEAVAIIKEIAQEEGISPKIAKIYTEQNKEKIAEMYRNGKIVALEGAPKIDEKTILSCEHIVALAGVEPYIEALKHGADVVVCGRSTDTAVIASYPIMQGCGEAVSWHAAKVTECGNLCTTEPFGGGAFVTINKDSFTVEATTKGASCTPYTVSAHMLYENSDPIRLTEPGIVIDTTNSKYEQLAGGRVRVTGTEIEHKPYTMKLEGSRAAGYQTASLTGVRDRDVMRDPWRWLNSLEAFVSAKLDKLGFDRKTYSVQLAPYGYNAVYGGEVPEGFVPNEIGVLLRVTADTQKLASEVARVYNPFLLHHPATQEKQMPSFAFPFSPNEFERGKLYEFVLHHVAMIDNFKEMLRIEYEF